MAIAYTTWYAGCSYTRSPCTNLSCLPITLIVNSRRLQLNVLKTELMWIGPKQRLQKLSGADITLMVGNDVIKPVCLHVVGDLGVYIDDELTMTQHVAKVAGAGFYHLRRLRQIRRHVSAMG